MKKRMLIGIALLTLVTSGFAQSDVSDADLLAALDAARFVDASSFAMTVEVVSQRPDGTEQALIQLFFKTNDAGQELFRLEFLKPEEMAGEVFITNPEGTFLWNPDLVTPLKVSARQGAFGDASVAETAGIRFAKGDYTVAARDAIQLDDGTPALELRLEATGPGVAFQAVRIVAEPDSLRPLSMRLFALGGDPINDVTFEAYGDLDGDSYVARQLIESRFVEGNKTLLTITHIEARQLDDALFDQTRLGGN